jgi:hypothetical protein
MIDKHYSWGEPTLEIPMLPTYADEKRCFATIAQGQAAGVPKTLRPLNFMLLLCITSTAYS